jgi:RimJ/RimL family protein N-acetyltransferase
MIQGTSIALGPILPTDLPNLFVWGDDPAIARLSEPYVPKNLQHENDFWLNAVGDPTRIFFAIRGRSSAEIIGYVQVTAINPVHRSASLGILIGRPEDRRRGYGREAMRLAIDYCWRSLNLSRLTLNVQATNGPAIELYQGLGFETEGFLRRALFIEGDWIDLKLMAIMRPER